MVYTWYTWPIWYTWPMYTIWETASSMTVLLVIYYYHS
jgi:hypothetical protein